MFTMLLVYNITIESVNLKKKRKRKYEPENMPLELRGIIFLKV